MGNQVNFSEYQFPGNQGMNYNNIRVNPNIQNNVIDKYK